MTAPPAAGRPPDAWAWAIRPCLYGGRRRERGETIRLSGQPTDQRLLDELYLQHLMPKNTRYACDTCDKVFVGGENFRLHVQGAHAGAASARSITGPGAAPAEGERGG